MLPEYNGIDAVFLLEPFIQNCMKIVQLLSYVNAIKFIRCESCSFMLFLFHNIYLILCVIFNQLVCVSHDCASLQLLSFDFFFKCRQFFPMLVLLLIYFRFKFQRPYDQKKTGRNHIKKNLIYIKTQDKLK